MTACTRRRADWSPEALAARAALAQEAFDAELRALEERQEQYLQISKVLARLEARLHEVWPDTVLTFYDHQNVRKDITMLLHISGAQVVRDGLWLPGPRPLPSSLKGNTHA